MHPTSNVMSQDSGSPNRLRGNYERLFTAVFQLVCGFIAVVCGLVLVMSKNPYEIDYYEYPFEKTSIGIWGGLVFAATAIPGIFGRHRKSRVGLYLIFCIASAVIAAVGLGLSITATNNIVKTKTDIVTSTCKDEDFGIDRSGRHHCCVERYRYDYDCSQLYYDWHDYDSPECESLRSSYKDCFQEAKRESVLHLAFYGIMVAVLSVELFASVYGACAALSALCNCCVGGKPTQYYTCSFSQRMVNDTLNNIVIPPPVPTQYSGPAYIVTTQMPHTYIGINVPR